MIKIEPIEVQSFPKKIVATHALIYVEVMPHAGAQVHVRLGTVNADGDFVDAIPTILNTTLTREQYDAWGEDDDYVVKCVLDAFGLVKSVEQEAPSIWKRFLSSIGF